MRHIEAGSHLALGVRTLVAARRHISWKECGIIIILPGGGISRQALLGFRNTLGGRMPCGLSQALSLGTRAEQDRYGCISWLNHYLVGDIKQMTNYFNCIALKDKSRLLFKWLISCSG